jgi:hypothetical protein
MEMIKPDDIQHIDIPLVTVGITSPMWLSVVNDILGIVLASIGIIIGSIRLYQIYKNRKK